LMKVNWPSGEIRFQSPSFTQSLRGTPVPNAGQWLPPELRGSTNAV
jgi:hypothetical protein